MTLMLVFDYVSLLTFSQDGAEMLFVVLTRVWPASVVAPPTF